MPFLSIWNRPSSKERVGDGTIQKNESDRVQKESNEDQELTGILASQRSVLDRLEGLLQGKDKRDKRYKGNVHADNS